MVVKQFQDGRRGRPPFWKSLYRHISATYRHWSVFLWRDPDDIPDCRILSPDKTEWRLISVTLCGMRTKTLFRRWPVMVHDTHTRRKKRCKNHPIFIKFCTQQQILNWMKRHVIKNEKLELDRLRVQHNVFLVWDPISYGCSRRTSLARALNQTGMGDNGDKTQTSDLRKQYKLSLRLSGPKWQLPEDKSEWDPWMKLR